mgnify:CR=1 FL=1
MALLQISEPDMSPDNPHNKTIVVGIDFGTTNSLVATVRNREAMVLFNHNNQTLNPSIVHYAANGDVVVGEEAQKYLNSDSQNTIKSIKRLIAKNYDELINSVYAKLHDLTFVNDKSNDNNNIYIVTRHGKKTIIDVIVDILNHIKQIAIDNLSQEPTACVITVPAYFDDISRQTIKLALQRVNLPLLRMLNEPTAAAIAYGLDEHKEGVFLVYDLGGGTFDVSLLRLNQGVFEVLAVGGDTNFGGDDFDNLIYEVLIKKLIDVLDKTDISMQSELKSNQLISYINKAYLLGVAKAIKENLTNKESVAFGLKFKELFTNNIKDLIDIDILDSELLEIQFTQVELYAISMPLLELSKQIIKKVLQDAQISLDEINEIILVGGSTKMSIVRDYLTKFFKRNLLCSINPEEVVVLGAAIQADILVGNRKNDLLLLDVTPLSLGIETIGGVCDVIIPRNSVIPLVKSQDFTNYKDDQTAISIHILQGESELVNKCRSLAKFTLTDLPKTPAGTLKIRVIFQIDADGILSVTATELINNISQSVEIRPSFGLNADDILQLL